MFLMNRIESLELEKQELANKGDNLSEKSFTNADNDLAGIEDANPGAEELEDLKDEILLLQKNNQLLLANQNSGKQELLTKLSDAEALVEDKNFEIKTLQEKCKIQESKLQRMTSDYDSLSSKFSD